MELMHCKESVEKLEEYRKCLFFDNPIYAEEERTKYGRRNVGHFTRKIVD